MDKKNLLYLLLTFDYKYLAYLVCTTFVLWLWTLNTSCDSFIYLCWCVTSLIYSTFRLSWSCAAVARAWGASASPLLAMSANDAIRASVRSQRPIMSCRYGPSRPPAKRFPSPTMPLIAAWPGERHSRGHSLALVVNFKSKVRKLPVSAKYHTAHIVTVH